MPRYLEVRKGMISTNVFEELKISIDSEVPIYVKVVCTKN